MQVATTHQIYYSNKNPIPIAQVAEALIALDNIVKRTPLALEKIFPGTKIEKVDLFIETIESGSLLEKIIVRYFFRSQENLDQGIDKLRKVTGMETLGDKSPILPAIVLALVMAGGAYALSFFGAPPESRTTIEANNNIIINIGAKSAGMEPEDYQAIIDAAVGNKAEAAKNTVKIIRPAKSDPESTIELDKTSDLTINNKTIKAIPTYLQEDLNEIETVDLENTEILIRAIDLDSSKRGWGVIIPSIGEKRIPMELGLGIKPALLFGKNSIYSDVTVLYKMDKKNKLVPAKAVLHNIIQENQSSAVVHSAN